MWNPHGKIGLAVGPILCADGGVGDVAAEDAVSLDSGALDVGCAPCVPYCDNIGTRGEGWYDGRTNGLMEDPLGASMLWSQRDKCDVPRGAKGSKSQGGHDSCSKKLLRLVKCDGNT